MGGLGLTAQKVPRLCPSVACTSLKVGCQQGWEVKAGEMSWRFGLHHDIIMVTLEGLHRSLQCNVESSYLPRIYSRTEQNHWKSSFSAVRRIYRPAVGCWYTPTLATVPNCVLALGLALRTNRCVSREFSCVIRWVSDGFIDGNNAR